MKSNETALVKAALDYLELCGWKVARPKRGKRPAKVGTIWRQNAGQQVIPATAGSKRRVLKAGPPGVSDIVGTAPDGRGFAAEAKDGKNKPTADQREYLAMVKAQGGVAFAFWSLDDLRKELLSWGYRAAQLA